MRKAIIADTSCLILLDNIGELDLLHKLYGTIITTSAVKSEFG
jgi:predicted nucleic acid-binding protein